MLELNCNLKKIALQQVFVRIMGIVAIGLEGIVQYQGLRGNLSEIKTYVKGKVSEICGDSF